MIISFPFTTCDDLKEKVKEFVRNNNINIQTMGSDENVTLALEPQDALVPGSEQNTVPMLLRQRVKMGVVLRHLELMKVKTKFSMLAPNAIFAMKLSGKLLDLSQLCFSSLPPLVLFDFHTKNCSADELGRAFASTSGSAFRCVCPEVLSNIAKACFNHPHAQGICAWSLTQALAKTIGEGYQVGHYEDQGIDIVGGFQGLGFMKDNYVRTVFVTPPDEMLSAEETKDLTIPKLIFAHPNAKGMDLKDSIGNMLLSAVRYRSPKLVQAILNHPSSSHITDETLETAIKEVSVEEPESMQTITNFIVNRVVKKKDQKEDQTKDGKCIIS